MRSHAGVMGSSFLERPAKTRKFGTRKTNVGEAFEKVQSQPTGIDWSNQCGLSNVDMVLLKALFKAGNSSFIFVENRNINFEKSDVLQKRIPIENPTCILMAPIHSSLENCVHPYRNDDQ